MGGAARRPCGEDEVLTACGSWRYGRGLVTALSPSVVSPDTTRSVTGCQQLAPLDSHDLDNHDYPDRRKEPAPGGNCEQFSRTSAGTRAVIPAVPARSLDAQSVGPAGRRPSLSARA